MASGGGCGGGKISSSRKVGEGGEDKEVVGRRSADLATAEVIVAGVPGHGGDIVSGGEGGSRERGRWRLWEVAEHPFFNFLFFDGVGGWGSGQRVCTFTWCPPSVPV